ncbi:F0F1 ATP synthase subunit B family protein [Sphingomonas bacterium]|uniref:F0F1 ATP synthase subunit B family protein n=1 Tax=Sphingomonas bacterium TaxID=1895847 RepID=UPI0015769BB0|nr:ATPase [Sphingomonas bacterium]
MPQLSQIGEIYASQLFWLAIVFAAIYFGIGRAMVPRIERTIDDRAARISGDLAAAQAARTAAAGSDETYESGLDAARAQAMKTVGEAQARATAATEARIKTSDADTEAKLHAATQRLATSKSQALAEVEGATVEAVQAIVAKLSGVSIDRAAAETRVKAELAHG